MGVHGLWRLIEPSGKPVPLETLENKVLAVDISIWLHQAVKGFQDSKGAPVPNAHLLGIYHRVCKLLYFKIKPVFVFDGGVPALKRETIVKRNQLKSRNSSEADRLQKQLLSTLLKHTAISKVLSEKTKASITAQTKKTSKHEYMYVLPSSEEMDSTLSSSTEDEDETEESTSDSPTKQWDLHTIDTKSAQFKSLPLEVRHEILTELKETRKQSSWGRLHELPKQSNDFSTYQMNRLLKRQSVQAALDEAAQEMGGSSLSLAELESLLKDKGVPTALNENVGKRIASDENTRYLYIKDVKEALEKAREEEKKKTEVQKEEQKNEETTDENINLKINADLEEEEELRHAIALSLQEVPSTSNTLDNRKMEISYLENFKDEDFLSDESDEDFEVPQIPVKKKISAAHSYLMEYSDLTPVEIDKLFKEKGKQPLKKAGFSKIKIIDKKSEIVQSSTDTIITDEIKKSDLTNKLKITNNDTKGGKNAFEIAKSSNSVIQNNFQVINENEKNERSLLSRETSNLDIQDKSSDNSNTLKESTNKIFNNKEVMSDSGDSTTSEDFIEITNVSKLSESKNVNSTKDVEHNENNEDIFSDIFEDKNDIEKLDAILLGMTKSTAEQGNQNETLHLKNQNPGVLIVTEKQEKENENSNINTIVIESNNTKNNEFSTKNDVGLKNASGNSKTTVDSIKESKGTKLSLDQMQEMKNDLLKEKTDLLIEKSIKERMAINITDQMYQEAQELLELFGVPYIIAPMEAEAQCAFLDEIELTDGTITDDSDIWLFGGRKVYKNFFNQSKYVLEFQAENIKHHFKLTREQMILLALLVGSDYTIGIQGVGPVTALEILAAFPAIHANELTLTNQQIISGLREFRSWFSKGQTGGPGKSNLKSKLKNITFTENFPSFQVVQAYLEPKVDTSKETFSWDKPDIIGLSLFAKEKFGWSSKKTDEILNPVIKRLEESRYQKSIKDYFKTKFKLDSGEIDGKMSKRVKTAIDRMGKTEEELITEEMEVLGKEKQKTMKKTRGSTEPSKRRASKKKISGLSSENSAQESKNSQEDFETISELKKVANKKKVIKNNKPRTKNDDSSSKKNSNNIQLNDNENAEQNSKSSEYFESTSKLNHKRKNPDKEDCSKRVKKDITKKIDNLSNLSTTNEEELKLYENVAVELKMRRQRNIELAKLKQDELKAQKQKKEIPKKLDVIPEELKNDEEVQFLLATTSQSAQRTEEIKNELRKEIDKEQQKKPLPNLHSKEVIHQRLRDRSNLLRNKMKAIEVFRKSKKGPGYVAKRQKVKKTQKEDAGLSEESSDE